MTSEEALEHSFRCPECDAVLVEENMVKRTEKVKKDIEKLQFEIDELAKIQKPMPKIEPEKKHKKKIKAKKIHFKKHEKKKSSHTKIFHPKKKPVHIPAKPSVHIPPKHTIHIPPKPKKSFFSALRKKLRRK